MTVLVGVIEASQMLGVSQAAVHKMRVHGRLIPVKSNPYRYSLAAIEAMRVSRVGKKINSRPRQGIEFIQESA